MVPIYILLLVLWWSITIGLLAWLSKSIPENLNYYAAISAIVLWPITAVMLSPLLFLRTTKEIKKVLHDNNLMEDFIEWYDYHRNENT